MKGGSQDPPGVHDVYLLGVDRSLFLIQEGDNDISAAKVGLVAVPDCLPFGYCFHLTLVSVLGLRHGRFLQIFLHCFTVSIVVLFS